MSGYTKLFASLLDSTIWREPNHVRLVWVTMLAMANRNGVVETSIPGLADRARVTIAECEEALAAFQSPDHYSRTKDHDGRRIEEVDGGFVLLNHGKYREIMSAEDQRERKRNWDREHRPNRPNSKHRLPPTTPEAIRTNPTNPTQAAPEAYAEAYKEGGASPKPTHPTLEEVKLQAAKIGLPDTEAERFVNYYTANGWRVGKNPMRSWPHALQNWKKGWEERVYAKYVHTDKPNPRNAGLATDPAKQGREIAEFLARKNDKPSL